jgi:predicted nucleotidyltransferase
VDNVTEDAHAKAVSCLLSRCQKLAVLSILTYGSYARGDYRPDSDIDLLVILDSNRYSSKDMASLIETCKYCREKFKVTFQMDIMLDSEIELWNKGILLDGHSFIDLYFYKRDGKVLLGKDMRDWFKLPQDFEEKAHTLLSIIESEFKRWFFQGEGEKPLVPHWMTGWLLVTFLNTVGIVDIKSFKETCRSINKIPEIADSQEFEKYEDEKELTPDEFIRLYRAIKSYSDKGRCKTS